MIGDREKKVIKGLEEFVADLKPYAGNSADWQKVDNALELLKDTQYCKPIMKTAHAQGADDVWYECKCGGFLSVNWNGVKVCKKCGRAVKWYD